MFLEATYDGRDLETSITSYTTAEQDTDTFLNTH